MMATTGAVGGGPGGAAAVAGAAMGSLTGGRWLPQEQKR
jgi:hypothetical protein